MFLKGGIPLLFKGGVRGGFYLKDLSLSSLALRFKSRALKLAQEREYSYLNNGISFPIFTSYKFLNKKRGLSLSFYLI